MQGLEMGVYQSDPTVEKEGHREGAYGPEMLETWLLLEFCDRCCKSLSLHVCFPSLGRLCKANAHLFRSCSCTCWFCWE
jgi:hypothetical protein